MSFFFKNPSKLLSLNVAQLCERLCFVYKCNLLHHPLTYIKMKTSHPYASLPPFFLNQNIVAKEIVALTTTDAHPPTSVSILATLSKIQNTKFIFFHPLFFSIHSKQQYYYISQFMPFRQERIKSIALCNSALLPPGGMRSLFFSENQ